MQADSNDAKNDSHKSIHKKFSVGNNVVDRDSSIERNKPLFELAEVFVNNTP